jgi:kinesin family protein 6/9
VPGGQIYMETLYDLLRDGDAAKGGSGDLTIAEDRRGATHVRGLALRHVASAEDAAAALFEGETNRAIASHQLNQSSTRSHCVFTVHVESRGCGPEDEVCNCVCEGWWGPGTRVDG